MEFQNIPELANQPSREQCKLAAHSEHEITGHKYQFSSALQVKENVSHLTNPPPFYFWVKVEMFLRFCLGTRKFKEDQH